MSIIVGAGPFCAGQSPPVTLHDLAHSAPLFDFCSNGQQIQYLNPLNNQKQLFTVPMQPWTLEWPPVLVPAVWHPPVVPPVIVPPPVVVPPIDDDDDCDHHHGPPPPPPPVVTPEPGTYGLMFAGGVFVVVMGRRRVRAGQ